MFPPYPKRAALVAATLLTLAGCAQLNKFLSSTFKKPTLNFKSAQLLEASLSGATVNLIYELNNPNPLGLSLAQVDYAFFVEGKQLVAGRPPNGLQIGAQKKTDLAFPTSVKFADLAQSLQTFLTKDRAKYRAEGTLGIKTPIGVISFPLSKEGEFEVPKIPTVALKSPRITQLSLSGLTLALPITVTNRNSFDLPLAGVSGNLAVSGVNVGNISTGYMGSLAAGGTREVSVPLTLSLASAPAAFSALKSGKAQFSLSGQLDSGGVGIPLRLSQLLPLQR
ncbi:MAG: LEA type 2 family protein [Myxococcaceae bacterium]